MKKIKEISTSKLTNKCLILKYIKRIKLLTEQDYFEPNYFLKCPFSFFSMSYFIQNLLCLYIISSMIYNGIFKNTG